MTKLVTKVYGWEVDGIDHSQVGYEANPSVNLTRSDEANLTHPISCHPREI
jgi:hypothetical protein